MTNTYIKNTSPSPNYMKFVQQVTNYAQDHAQRPWADIPKLNQHLKMDGSRSVFGMCRDSGATVLVPWTGPREARHLCPGDRVQWDDNTWVVEAVTVTLATTRVAVYAPTIESDSRLLTLGSCDLVDPEVRPL